VAVVLVSGISRAEQPDPRILYERGIAHYNLGELDAAISDFKEAYAVSQAPRLLFNIAQAERLKRDYSQALLHYRTYLRLEPNASNRGDVMLRIDEMKKLVNEATRPPPPPLPPEKLSETASENVPARPPQEPPHQEPLVVPPHQEPLVVPPPTPHAVKNERKLNGKMVVGFATGGVGVALLIGASIATGLATSEGGQVQHLIDTGGQWSSNYKAILNDGYRNQSAAIGLWVIGGVATLTGGVIAFLGWRDLKRAPAPTVTPTPGGGSLTLTWKLP
jgi:tetratricopeptide (TPR) repeat protein